LIQADGLHRPYRFEAAELALAGWSVGVSITPSANTLDPVLPDGGEYSAVQLLTTTTPGQAGGRFRADAPRHIDAYAPLARQRAASLEVDGGVTPAVADQLQTRCDLIVLGSNSLITSAAGMRVPRRSTTYETPPQEINV
jgi:pentose-5-phosphate-3-epimerase